MIGLRYGSIAQFIGIIIYLSSMIFAMLLSQMIGSNNALVNLAGLFFGSIVFIIYIKYLNIYKYVTPTVLTFKSFVKSRLIIQFYLAVVVSIFVLSFLSVSAVYLLGIDLERFRIFGFGSGELSSVSSRMALWDNFSDHFSHNPIIGNMAIDKLTTGEGTYVHSFIGSILTHLGLVGFILALIYLFLAVKEKLSTAHFSDINKLISIYSLSIFFGVFLIASFGTFFTWSPIWFLFGFIFPGVECRNRYRSVRF